jgi:hypothetical protein
VIKEKLAATNGAADVEEEKSGYLALPFSLKGLLASAVLVAIIGYLFVYDNYTIVCKNIIMCDYTSCDVIKVSILNYLLGKRKCNGYT